MSSLELFDLAIMNAQPGSVGAQSGDAQTLAESLIGALLREVEYLHRLNKAFTPGSGQLPARTAAVLMRAAYQKWVQTADEAIEKISRMRAGQRSIQDFDRLLDEHGRLRAMLSVTLDQIDQARDQIRNGRTHTREEIQRELRLGSQR